MNYYEHHIGDYAEATAHLSFVEDAAYTRLIRKYYSTEQPLPSDKKIIQRLVGARTKEEKEAVSTVLDEFFILDADGWHNRRCDEEISRFQDKQAKAKRSAEARWNKPRSHTEGNANAMRTHTEGNAHQTPDTSHQSPVTSLTTHTEESSPGVTEAGAVCVLLRSKGFGTVNPGHQKLLDLLAAGMHIGAFDAAADIAKSKGKGFDYVLGIVAKQLQDQTQMAENARASPPIPHETPYQRATRERVAEFAPALARKAPAAESPAITIIDGGQNVTAIGSR